MGLDTFLSKTARFLNEYGRRTTQFRQKIAQHLHLFRPTHNDDSPTKGEAACLQASLRQCSPTMIDAPKTFQRLPFEIILLIWDAMLSQTAMFYLLLEETPPYLYYLFNCPDVDSQHSDRANAAKTIMKVDRASRHYVFNRFRFTRYYPFSSNSWDIGYTDRKLHPQDLLIDPKTDVLCVNFGTDTNQTWRPRSGSDLLEALRSEIQYICFTVNHLGQFIKFRSNDPSQFPALKRIYVGVHNATDKGRPLDQYNPLPYAPAQDDRLERKLANLEFGRFARAAGYFKCSLAEVDNDDLQPIRPWYFPEDLDWATIKPPSLEYVFIYTLIEEELDAIRKYYVVSL
ncbi:hypothetical protein GGR51DRAFT_562481 [Nemania sp. FL0031]|nr:hypothetical protein GGR51DRAFT_562481 [Nemania sp. FL0031]